MRIETAIGRQISRLREARQCCSPSWAKRWGRTWASPEPPGLHQAAEDAARSPRPRWRPWPWPWTCRYRRCSSPTPQTSNCRARSSPPRTTRGSAYAGERQPPWTKSRSSSWCCATLQEDPVAARRGPAGQDRGGGRGSRPCPCSPGSEKKKYIKKKKKKKKEGARWRPGRKRRRQRPPSSRGSAGWPGSSGSRSRGWSLPGRVGGGLRAPLRAYVPLGLLITRPAAASWPAALKARLKWAAARKASET